jgi:hypothetical protein
LGGESKNSGPVGHALVVFVCVCFFFWLPNFDLKNIISTWKKDLNSMEKNGPNLPNVEEFIFIYLFSKSPYFYAKFQ